MERDLLIWTLSIVLFASLVLLVLTVTGALP